VYVPGIGFKQHLIESRCKVTAFLKTMQAQTARKGALHKYFTKQEL